MKYEEFVSAVVMELKNRMKGEVSVTENKVLKNNSMWKQGVTIRKNGCNAAPTIYLEEYYRSYCAGNTVEKVTDELLQFYQTLEWYPETEFDWISDYSRVKWKIVPKLISKCQNEGLLEEVPYFLWVDLALVFYVLLNVNGKGTTTMLLRNSHLERWKITKGEVYETAMLNAPCLLPAELHPISEVIEGMMETKNVPSQNLLETKEHKEKEGMYVLTNRINSFGAVCIVYPQIAEKIGDILQENYYVLPSSIHEMIIVPESKSVGREAFHEMICEINRTQVEKEEVLAESAYYYDRKKGEFSQ